MTRQAIKAAAWQAAGLCRACGSPQAPGCSLCECHRERKRAADAKRKSAGQCVEAGCGKRPEGGRIRCAGCHAKLMIAQKAWLERTD